MSIKETFKPEEWKNLIGLPMLAAYAVAGAAPSGQDDFIREMAGAAQGIIENERTARESSLLSEVIADIMANADDDQRGQTEKVSVNDIKQRVLAKSREVAGILDSRVTSEDAYDYKRFVLVVAERVAEAAKEGGLFGFGGEQISSSEVAEINEIGEAISI